MKGKALRRALATTDILRITEDVPNLTDTTEVITPERAYALLEHNQNNRPINWHKVEDYAIAMRQGQWKVHGQGIMLDTTGNILTGQHRLWAVIYADRPIPMRISSGNHPSTAQCIDRGIPQSARDLASRTTGRKHSPLETSLARCLLMLEGNNKPNTDAIADTIIRFNNVIKETISQLHRTKKTRSVVMLAGAIAAESVSLPDIERKMQHMEIFVRTFDDALMPSTAQQCWGRGAAFSMAMQKAVSIVRSI